MGNTRDAETTRQIAPLSRRADVRPESVNVEARTVDVDWTTGAPVLRGGIWSDPFWEELSLDPRHVRLDRLNNGAPFLESHSGYSTKGVLGVVVPGSARIEQGRGVATVRFAKAEDDPEADRVFRKIRDGILQNVSVGYRVHRFEDVGRAADDIQRKRAVDWQPFEVSVVPMGADDGAGFRGTDLSPNTCVFATREERSMDAEKTTETPKPPAAAATDALVEQARVDNQRAADAAEKLADERAKKAVDAERIRISEIRRICARTKLGEGLAQRLIEAKTSVDEARKIVLDEKIREQDDGIDPHARFEAGDDRTDKFRRGAVASLLERAGLSQTIEEAKTNKRVGHFLRDVATDAGELRGMTMLDLARASLEVRGISTKGLFGERLVNAALQFRGDAGFNTTSDFAVLLETAVNKTFLGAYATIPVTWPMWCARKSVQDFRTSSFYRPGSFGVLDTLTEGGEIKHKNIPDGAKATLTPATKANIVGVSRKAIVNDDLGFLSDMGAGLGAAAARTIEADAWALITAASGLGANAPDGVALFNAAHSNIGTTGAMSVATLDSLRVKMALQKDPSSNAFLALRPAILLVPVELSGTAMQFIRSAADPTDAKNSNVANKVQNLFPAIIDSPYLSASSATRVYGLADPAIGPVFAVGFINGQEAPTLTSEQSFEYDGMQMRIVMDYGTAVIDYRGAATCAGA